HGVHGVAHIDETAKSAEAEHDKRKDGCQYHRLTPWERPDPAKQSAAAADTSSDFKACPDREHSYKRGQSHQKRQKRLHEFKASAMLGIGQQVMHPNRHREDQKHDECQTAHGIAIEPSPG